MLVCLKCRAAFDPYAGGGRLCSDCKLTEHLGASVELWEEATEPPPSEVPPEPTPAPAPAPPAGPVRRVPRWPWLVVGTGLLWLLLVETGAIVTENSVTNRTAEGRYTFESSWSGPPGKPAPLHGVHFAPTVAVSVPPGAGYDLATEAAAWTRSAVPTFGASGGAKMEITITHVTPLFWAAWAPIRKSGSCSFVATYSISASTPWSSFSARGQITGNVHQTMTGLCSAGRFREKMARAISAAILEDLGKTIAKHS